MASLTADLLPGPTATPSITPESEIEVKNVADFIRRNKSAIKAYITVHSYSQLVLFPYSYTFDLAADHSELLKLGKEAAAALRSLYGTTYTIGPGAATIVSAPLNPGDPSCSAGTDPTVKVGRVGVPVFKGFSPAAQYVTATEYSLAVSPLCQAAASTLNVFLLLLYRPGFCDVGYQ